MRQNDNSRRPRGRNVNKRRSGPARNQTYDSNGPSVRIRGNAHQVHEKYLAMARDANAAGDRVAAENFFQHAEHYYRIMVAQQEEAATRNQAKASVSSDSDSNSERSAPARRRVNGRFRGPEPQPDTASYGGTEEAVVDEPSSFDGDSRD